MFLCVCKAVKVSEAVEAAQSGVVSPESIRRHFGFDDDECCGRCADNIDSFAAVVRIRLKQVERLQDDSARAVA